MPSDDCREKCPLCSSIQQAIETERSAVERLIDSAHEVGFRLLPPEEGDGVRESDWLEFAVRRDEYERARTKRVRADNRFFDACPRCHFELKPARRELEALRAELPWYRNESARILPQVRATGS